MFIFFLIAGARSSEMGQRQALRGYKEAADKKRELELFWTRSMKERMRNGSDEKREEAMVQERKRIVSLQKLKEQGGPFTSAEEVDYYLSDSKEDEARDQLCWGHVNTFAKS